MTLSTSFWGWWEADQTLLLFTPCQGVACAVLSYAACRALAEAGGAKVARQERCSSCASALVTVHESHQPLLGSKLSLHGWQLETKQMRAAVVREKRGPAVLSCKAHSGAQSTSGNNSRNQNSEFLSSFLITQNSNHFKTTGRELLRPMTHCQPLSGQAVCLGGERQLKCLLDWELQHPAQRRIMPIGCRLSPSIGHQPHTRRDRHPKTGWPASPDLTDLQSNGAEAATRLKWVPKTPTSPLYLGHSRVRTARLHAPKWWSSLHCGLF